MSLLPVATGAPGQVSLVVVSNAEVAPTTRRAAVDTVPAAHTNYHTGQPEIRRAVSQPSLRRWDMSAQPPFARVGAGVKVVLGGVAGTDSTIGEHRCTPMGSGARSHTNYAAARSRPGRRC